MDIHNFGDKELAKELETLKKIEYLDACRHCSIIEEPIIVPPGEQLGMKERGK